MALERTGSGFGAGAAAGLGAGTVAVFFLVLDGVVDFVDELLVDGVAVFVGGAGLLVDAADLVDVADLGAVVGVFCFTGVAGAFTVAPADEAAVAVDPVVVQMLDFEPLGFEPGHPQDRLRSTGALIPAIVPVALYCQNVHAFQPPGVGTGRAAEVWFASHSGYWANEVVLPR